MLTIGIDVGGTSIKGAAVDETGKVYEKFVLPIEGNKSPEETVTELVLLTKKYIEDNNLKSKISGIGIGLPGSVDTSKGVVTFLPNLKWYDLPLADKFKEVLNYPIKITNDANAAALAECKFGAGKKYSNLVMITLGTGVGGGIIIDGKLYEGLNGKGAELGHTSIIYNGLPCTCGRRGCFEMYASATALIRQTKEAMDLDKNSLMWKEAEKEGKVNGKVAFNAAKLGDESANKVVDQYVEYLSEGLLNICNVFRPECIVLSGGIANQGQYLVDKVNSYCEKYSFGYPSAPKSIIKIAELGYETGIIGAASLFF